MGLDVRDGSVDCYGWISGKFLIWNLLHPPPLQNVLSTLAPVLSGLETALGVLRCSLEPRVYVAVGRAMWDHTGRDLYDFVQGLTEGGCMGDNDGSMEGAWRARQRAGIALACLNDFFTQRLALYEDAQIKVKVYVMCSLQGITGVLRQVLPSKGMVN